MHYNNYYIEQPSDTLRTNSHDMNDIVQFWSNLILTFSFVVDTIGRIIFIYKK